MTSEAGKSDVAFVREVRIGLAAICICLTCLCYVAYVRMNGGNFDWLTGRQKTASVAPSSSHSHDNSNPIENPVETNKLNSQLSANQTGVGSNPAGVSNIETQEKPEKEFTLSIEQPSFEIDGNKNPADPLLPVENANNEKPSTDSESFMNKANGFAKSNQDLSGSNPPNDNDSETDKDFRPLQTRHSQDKSTTNPGSHFEVRPATHVNSTGQAGNNKSIAEHDNEKTVATDEERIREITSLPDDNFWSIAQREYEDGRLFRALYLENQERLNSDGTIKPGSKIKIPAREILIEKWPEACQFANRDDSDAKKSNFGSANSGSKSNRVFTYITRPEDTLFSIAREQLGQAYRYAELIRLNRDRLPSDVAPSTTLAPGIELQMPGIK